MFDSTMCIPAPTSASRTGTPAARTLLLLAAAAALAAPGCVHRKLVIRSQPEGAIVTLDGVELPTPTPVEVESPFDGTHRVMLAAPGYEVLEGTAHVDARWHDWFPLDVFAEFLWPGTIEDVREFSFDVRSYGDRTRAYTEAERASMRERMAAVTGRAAAHRAGDVEAMHDHDGHAPAAAPAPSEPPPVPSVPTDPSAAPAAPRTPGVPLPPPKPPRNDDPPAPPPPPRSR